MAKRCYYETLEVERTVDDGGLKSAFRKLAMKWHPDKNPGDSDCEHRFKEINEAYEVLKDPDKRAAYDRFGHAAFEQGMGAGDTRIEKQEWHLTQEGDAIAGYYIAALTFVSGDGRPYVCSRQPQFSTVQRFDVSGRVRASFSKRMARKPLSRPRRRLWPSKGLVTRSKPKPGDASRRPCS